MWRRSAHKEAIENHSGAKVNPAGGVVVPRAGINAEDLLLIRAQALNVQQSTQEFVDLSVLEAHTRYVRYKLWRLRVKSGRRRRARHILCHPVLIVRLVAKSIASQLLHTIDPFFQHAEPTNQGIRGEPTTLRLAELCW